MSPKGVLRTLQPPSRCQESPQSSSLHRYQPTSRPVGTERTMYCDRPGNVERAGWGREGNWVRKEKRKSSREKGRAAQKAAGPETESVQLWVQLRARKHLLGPGERTSRLLGWLSWPGS